MLLALAPLLTLNALRIQQPWCNTIGQEAASLLHQCARLGCQAGTAAGVVQADREV
jgi:hypothetical protein